MSLIVSVVLDTETACVTRSDGDRTGVVVRWSPDAPDALAEAIRPLVGAPSAMVLVIGMGLLEIAQPDLPPLSFAARRALLLRDADRYFPVAEPVAVAWSHGFALAMPARTLAAVVRALSSVGPVRAVLTAPEIAMPLVVTGRLELPAGAGERGLLDVVAGTPRAMRRVLTAHTGVAGSAGAESALLGASHTERPVDRHTDGRRDQVVAPVRVVTSAELGRDALHRVDAPLDAQLLDAALRQSMSRSRQRRWVWSGVFAAAALAALVWSAGHWRDRTLAALQSEIVQLERRAEPALGALARAERAQAEQAVLRDAAARERSPDAPLTVLAQLTRVLPRDAFVQRLEWDGAQWRVEGTADHAPALVPMLDGDAHFASVRIVAPSQRFLDMGRQRETFAMSFRMRAPSDRDGGAHGTR